VSGQSVSITLTIDEAQALKAWTSQQAAVEKMRQQLGKMDLKTTGMGALQSGASNVAKSLASAASQLVGIGSAVGGLIALAMQLKAEYQTIVNRQKEAAGVHVDYATEISTAIRSTGGKISGPEMEQMVMEGSKRTGQSPTVVARNFNAAFTAKGPRNREEAVERMQESEAAMQQYPEQDAQTLAQITAVTAQNKQAFGLNTQQAIGYQQKAQNVSFVKDVQSFAANVAGKLSAISKSGDTNAQEAGSLAGTFSQAGGDFEGSTSTLAALTFAAELKERLPHLPDFKSRLDEMHKNPQENAKKFLEGGEFNGKKHSAAETGRSIYKAHVADMLNPNSKLVQEYKQNLNEYGDAEIWEIEAANVRKEVKSSPSVIVADAKRQIETSKQQIQLDDSKGAMAGVSRDGLQEILKAAGVSDIEQKMALASFELNTSLGSQDPMKEVRKQLDEQADVLESPTSTSDTRSFFNGFTLGIVPSELHKDEEQNMSDKVKASRLRNASKELGKVESSFQATDKVKAEKTARAEIKWAKKPGEKPEKTLPANDPSSSGDKQAAEPQKPQTPLESAENTVLDLETDSNATTADVGAAKSILKEAQSAASTGGGADAGTAKAFEQLINKLDSLEKTIATNNKLTQDNNKATDENTKSGTKPGGSGPPPKAKNVTTLQNAGT
jgi:hypothetical protein